MTQELLRKLKDRPYFFDEGLCFECRRCGSCCTGEPGIVYVTAEEINDIATYLTIEREVVVERCLHPFQDSHRIREDEEGRCIFYENGCAIYPVRPAQCRTFPFWFQNLASEDAWDETRLRCPGIGHGRRYSKEEIFASMEEGFKSYVRAINELLEKG